MDFSVPTFEKRTDEKVNRHFMEGITETYQKYA